jgi:hypothetical protein
MRKILLFAIKSISYNFALKKAKKKGLLIYLKTLQVVRKSMLFAFMLFLTLQLMMIGFVGAIASGVWLIPVEDQATRLWILFGVFSGFFIIPFLALIFIFSEKTWLKISGADDLLVRGIED